MVKPPSQLQIDNEGMVAMWDGLALKLEHLAAPRHLPHGFLEITAARFHDEGLSGCHDVFEAVCTPTDGTGKGVLGLRVSRAFDLYLTCAAKDALDIVCH